MTLIDDLLKRNEAYVSGRAPQPWPEAGTVSLAVVACFDPRLDPMLRPALGLGEGEGFMLRTAGAVVAPDSHLLRALAVAVYLFEVEQVLIVGHSSCKMASFPTDDFIAAFRRRGVGREAFGDGDLRRWAGAIATPRDGVLATAAAILDAPFLPPDLAVAGAVLDDGKGRLEMILRPGEPLPGRIRKPAEEAASVVGEPAREPAPTAEAPPADAGAPPVPLDASAPDLGELGLAIEQMMASGAPPNSVETLHPTLGQLYQAVERLAASGAGDDLRRLQKAVDTEVYPMHKLRLIQRFVQRTARSPELGEAFSLVERLVKNADYHLAARALADLFGPLLGKKKP